MKLKPILIASGTLGLLFFAGTAWGQLAPDDTTTELLDLFIASSGEWVDTLRRHGRNLLLALAGIWLIVLMYPHVFKRPDLGEILGDLVKFILVIGFFLLLLEWGPNVGQTIIQSFHLAGSEAAGSSDILRPGDVAKMSIDFFMAVSDGLSWNPSHIGMNLFLVISAFIVAIGFGFIALMMFVTLVESYIVINAAVLFFGFGGSPWTKDYAITALRYALAVGAKLFVLILIAAVVVGASDAWMAAYSNDRASTITLVLIALLSAYLCKTIPDTIQGLISGVSPGTGAALGSMATLAVAAASVGAGMAAAGAGVAGQASSGTSNLAKSIGSSLAGGLPGMTGGEATPPPAPNPPGGAVPRGSQAKEAPAAPMSKSSGSGLGSQLSAGARSGIPSGKHLASVVQSGLKGTSLLSSLTVPGMDSGAVPSSGPIGNAGDDSFASSSSSSLANDGEPMNIIGPAESSKTLQSPSANSSGTKGDLS